MNKANEIASNISKINPLLTDIEWRIFKEWQRVIPDEPFFAYAYNSIVKRATKEGLNVDNLINANALTT